MTSRMTSNVKLIHLRVMRILRTKSIEKKLEDEKYVVGSTFDFKIVGEKFVH